MTIINLLSNIDINFSILEGGKDLGIIANRSNIFDRKICFKLNRGHIFQRKVSCVMLLLILWEKAIHLYLLLKNYCLNIFITVECQII